LLIKYVFMRSIRKTAKTWKTPNFFQKHFFPQNYIKMNLSPKMGISKTPEAEMLYIMFNKTL
jgi:hypothetical protein